MGDNLNLNQYKRSDVYTFEVDQSQNVSLPLATGRLVIGSSRKGPMNTVVLINDPKNSSNVYGDIDTKLEAKGSFFQRMILTSLKEGPVYGLNIIPVADQDTANFVTFNTEFSAINTPPTINAFTQPISSFFNTQRFWYASDDSLNTVKNARLSGPDLTKIISLANLGKRSITTFIHLTTVNGYDLTVKEYYALFGNNNELPTFLNPDDFISDYFVEVIVVEGDWSNNLKLNADPIYGQYFDQTGIKESQITNFLNLKEVNVIVRATGSLIPDFQDQSGLSASIDKIINSTYTQTELLCAIDMDSVDTIDLTSTAFDANDVTSQRLDLVGYGFSEMTGTVDDIVDDTINGTGSNAASLAKLIDILGLRKPTIGNFDFKTVTTTAAAGQNHIISSGTPYIKAYLNSSIYNAFQNGFLTNGNHVTGGSVSGYLKYEDGFSDVLTSVTVPYIKVTAYSDSALTSNIDITTIQSSGSVSIVATTYLHVITGGQNFSQTFSLTDTNFFTSYTFTAPNQLTLVLNTSITIQNKALLDSYIKVNQYLKALLVNGSERTRMVKIISVASSSLSNVITYVVTTMAPSDVNNRGIDTTGQSITAYIGTKNFISNVRGIFLPAFVLRPALLPDGSDARQDDILGFMYNSTNIAKALADKQSVDFRYIIDSYQGQISPSSKFYLAQTAADHGQALVIANAPSMKQFEKNVDPSFIDPTTKLISAQYIAQGGNLDLNPSFTFAFAQGDENGIPISSYIAYFGPNFMINDGGRLRSVPPAAYVGNAFSRKYKSGNTFSLVAGGKRGALNDVEIDSLEYNFTDDDRDILEPFGLNMVVKRRGFGNLIMSNSTGYQRINSSLNNIHVREALVTIERDINTILFNFLFDFNDEITQLRVRTITENYLDSVQQARGIATYTVTFNSTNNTSDVIAANAGILDIEVDFPRGIQKFINRITITRVGGQLSSSSTGFIPSF